MKNVGAYFCFILAISLFRAHSGRGNEQRNSSSNSTELWATKNHHSIPSSLSLPFEAIQELPRHYKILDVGCGSGQDALALSQMGFEVVGVDPNSAAIEEANRTAQTRGLDAKFYVGSATNLPLESKKFDLVIFKAVFTVLGNTQDREFALTEASRVANKDGKIMILDFLRTWTKPKYAWRYISGFMRYQDLGMFPVYDAKGALLYSAKHYSKTELDKLLKLTSWTIEALECSKVLTRSGNAINGISLSASRER
ncbi:MAG: class I SAM-dependent methyltransferase [Bdellovibrionota bacterium]